MDHQVQSEISKTPLEATRSSDGRHRRKRTNSRLLLQAALDLMLEAEGRMPTMEAVAKRSGLSLRSGFDHFQTIGKLRLAALQEYNYALRVGTLIANRAGMPPPECGAREGESLAILQKWWDAHLIALAHSFAVVG